MKMYKTNQQSFLKKILVGIIKIKISSTITLPYPEVSNLWYVKNFFYYYLPGFTLLIRKL